MREREEATAVPPAEMTDYRRWCAEQGMQPFGHPAAVSQWDVWRELRGRWAQAHGVDGGDLEMVGPAPFDPDLV
jgi:hypothetical protein